MFGMSMTSLSAAMLGAALFVTGCSTANKESAQSTLTPSTQAVTCSKCQVTWVKVPEMAKSRIVGYSSRKSMVCPDCKDAVASFFASGKFQHTCKTCGDSMELCEAH